MKHRLALDVGEPRLGVVGDGLVGEEFDESAPLRRGQDLGARGVHHRRHIVRHHEHGPPHTEKSQQGTIVVQRTFQVGDVEPVDPRTSRQVDRCRVTRVEPNDVAGDGDHVICAPRQDGAGRRVVLAAAHSRLLAWPIVKPTVGWEAAERMA